MSAPARQTACPDENVLADFASGFQPEADESALWDHLADCQSCSRIVACLSGATASRASLEEGVRARAGATVGRYVVDAVLGVGGMSIVYAATDPELGRKVALKLLRRETGDPERVAAAQARHAREAQALARLAHPNVVAVFDVGTVNGDTFIAMELIEGSSLRRWLKDAPRSLHDIVNIFLQAGQGLAAAHAAHLVHRDFKPDNVLVGKDGRVRVTDFGLAKPQGTAPDAREAAAGASSAARASVAPRPEGTAVEPALTRARSVVGTVAYMSAEQLEGRPADAASDLFSFCVALYEALYGERPFAGDTAGAVLANIRAGRVRPPPAQARVPAWIRRVLLRGLAADPARRHPTMEALLAALSLSQNERRARQRTLAGLSTALVLAALCGGYVLLRARSHAACDASDALSSTWNADRLAAMDKAFSATAAPYAGAALTTATQMIDRFVEEWRAASLRACEDTRVNGREPQSAYAVRSACLGQRHAELRALLDLFAAADSGVVQRAARAAQQLSSPRDCLREELLTTGIVPPPLSAQAEVDRIRRELAAAVVLQHAGRFAAARDAARALGDQARALAYAPLDAEILFALGRSEKNLDERREARTHLITAALSAEATRDDRLAARAYVEAVSLLIDNDEDGELTSHLLDQADASARRLGADEELEGEILLQRAYLAYSRGDNLGAAHDYAERAVQSLRGTRGRDDESVADALGLLGGIDVQRGEYEKGVAIQEESVQVYTRMYGPAHPTVASGLGNLAYAQLTGGLVDQARASSDKAYSIALSALGAEHSFTLTLLEAIGEAQYHQGQHREAVATLTGALPRLLEAFGSGSDRVSKCQRLLARAYLALGDSARALEVAAQAVAATEQTRGPDTPLLAPALIALGEVQASREALPAAERALGRAVLLLEKAAIWPGELARARLLLADVLWRANRKQDRERALALGALACAGFARVGGLYAKEAPAAEEWLRRRRPL